MHHWNKCSYTNHTSGHRINGPCLETKKGAAIKNLQGIATLKDLLNNKRLEKYVEISNLYRYWQKVSFN